MLCSHSKCLERTSCSATVRENLDEVLYGTVTVKCSKDEMISGSLDGNFDFHSHCVRFLEEIYPSVDI